MKALDKESKNLPRRRPEDLSRVELIWHYYFDMDREIVLTPTEHEYRKSLEMAWKLFQQYYPMYSQRRIAALLFKKRMDLDQEVTERTCFTIVEDAIKIFGYPNEVDKELKRNIYITRLHKLAEKAEKELNFNAAIKAVEKAADLEQFHMDADERIREMLKNKEPKEIVFASSFAQLEELREQKRKEILEGIPEAELDGD